MNEFSLGVSSSANDGDIHKTQSKSRLKKKRNGDLASPKTEPKRDLKGVLDDIFGDEFDDDIKVQSDDDDQGAESENDTFPETQVVESN